MGTQLLLNKNFEWFEKNGLLEEIKQNYNSFKKILQNSLAITDEKVLIIGDYGYPTSRGSAITTGCYAMAAEELKLNNQVVMQQPKTIGERADDNVIRALLDLEEKNVVITTLSGKFGSLNGVGKSFRKFCIRKKHRFISALDLGFLPTKNFNAITNAINIDYDLMNQRAQKLKSIFDDASEVNITTTQGTELYFNIKGMKTCLNTGNYVKPGTGGNIPAGEVYLPPNKNKVEGKVVIDGSLRTRSETYLLKEPVTLTVEKGNVTKIEGPKASLLEETLQWAHETSKHPWGVRRIGELGIGINPGASMAGPTLINEKLLGTAHVAIGSNYWFGGSIYAKIHLDQVFKNPVIKVDGEIINPENP